MNGSRKSVWGIMIALLVLAMFTTTACQDRNGTSGEEVPPAPEQPDPVPPEEPSGDARALIYLLDGERLVAVVRDVPAPAVASGAVTALFDSPTADESSADLNSEIPAGTRLLGVNVDGRTAVVDVSDSFDDGGGSLSMTARVAQVVFTLTQFDTIDDVLFRMDGEPLEVLGGEGIMIDDPQTRDMWEQFAPPVLIENPAWGEDVTAPVRVSGSANVFEATFFLDVVDGSGAVKQTQLVTATSGSGERGTFDVTIPVSDFEAGTGRIDAWFESAEDGSRQEAGSVAVELR